MSEQLPDRILAEWVFHDHRYQVVDKGSDFWIMERAIATEDDFPRWDLVMIL